MPDAMPISVARSGQADKIGPCPDCGTPTPYRTNRALCEDCRKRRKREKDRKAAFVQRRKRGVEEVKGVEAKCDNCPTIIVRRTRTHRLCEVCSPLEDLLRARVTQDRKSRALGRVPLSDDRYCRHCGDVFSIKGRDEAAAIYCLPCRALSDARKLPAARAAIAKWRRDRMASDPAFAMNARMRHGIRGSLQGAKAGRAWESLVGYTIHDLMRHLERQFLKRMSWTNRGEWQIDHITPLALFKFETAEDPEFKAAWALSNLRPLWKPDNNEKRAKRLFLI